MRPYSTILAVIGVILVVALAGCEGSEHGESEHHAGEGGEESGTQLTLSETYDEVRAGARLILAYDSTANAFVGPGREHHRRHAQAGPGRGASLERDRARPDHSG